MPRAAAASNPPKTTCDVQGGTTRGTAQILKISGGAEKCRERGWRARENRGRGNGRRAWQEDDDNETENGEDGVEGGQEEGRDLEGGAGQKAVEPEGQKDGVAEREGEKDSGNAAGTKEGSAQSMRADEHLESEQELEKDRENGLENRARGQNEAEKEGEKEGERESERTGGNSATWPKWMANGHTILNTCPVGGSNSSWATVVTWALLEEAYSFESSVSRNSIYGGKH